MSDSSESQVELVGFGSIVLSCSDGSFSGDAKVVGGGRGTTVVDQSITDELSDDSTLIRVVMSVVKGKWV